MLRPHPPASLDLKLPAPSRWFALLDSRIPLKLKKKLLEPRLNKVFAAGLLDDEFELLEGRYLQLDIKDLGISLTLTLLQGRLSLSEYPGEAVIRGDWYAFLRLALKREDPDGLFFRRQLVIEGDTELGLGIKNLLDSLDWSLEKGLEGRLLLWLEKLNHTLRNPNQHQQNKVSNSKQTKQKRVLFYPGI